MKIEIPKIAASIIDGPLGNIVAPGGLFQLAVKIRRSCVLELPLLGFVRAIQGGPFGKLAAAQLNRTRGVLRGG